MSVVIEGSHGSTGYGGDDGCQLCGHRCGVDRRVERGRCRSGVVPVLAAAVIHRGEEPCLGGERGLGNLFFGGCSLRCLFCQNHGISQADRGQPADAAAIAEAMLTLQGRGAGGIGLVTPTHVTPTVVEAIARARAGGLTVPMVHNGSACETPETLARLAGAIDIYLPDLKWADAAEARRYSGAPWYPQVSREAIRIMYDQVGPIAVETDGLASNGLLVRHLVLPDDATGSADLLAWLAEAAPGCGLSLLRQYVPMHRAVDDPRLGRPITDGEYDEVVEFAGWLGFDPIFVQEAGSTEVGVPDWDAPEVFDWR